MAASINEPLGPVHISSGSDSQTNKPPRGRVHYAPGQVGELARQSIEHGIAFFAIEIDQEFDVLMVGAALQQCVDDVLGQVVRAEVVVALQAHQRIEKVRRDQGIPRLQSRRAWLGESSSVDDELVANVEALDARPVVPVEAKFAIGRVLENENALLLPIMTDEFEQLLATLKGHGPSGRILEIVDDVNQLHAVEFTTAVEPFQQTSEVRRAHPVIIHRHGQHANVAARQQAMVNEIRRRFGDNDVARIEQDLREQIKQLLGARRNDYVLRRQVAFLGGERRRKNRRAGGSSRAAARNPG